MATQPATRLASVHDQALGIIARHRQLAQQGFPDEADLDAVLWERLVPLLVEPVSSGPAEVERVGFGYRAHFSVVGIEMQLSRIRETRQELHGELVVRFSQAASVFDRHLFVARVNLSSSSARNSTAKFLNERFKADWISMLERFTVSVLEMERTPAPLEEIGTRPTGDPDRWLLRPLLLKGKPTIIYGPGGSWKSTLGVAVAVSLTTGQTVIPGWEVAPSKVLVLDWEDDGSNWNDRARRIAVGAGMAPPAVAYRHMERPLAEELETLAETVDRDAFEVLILDSAGLAIGVGHEGEPAADGVFRLFAALRQLKAASLIIDHVTSADVKGNGAAKPYGSVYKMNLARNVFEVQNPKEVSGDRAEFILRQSKTNGVRIPPQELAITYGEGTIRFERSQVTDAALKASLSLCERMVRALAENGALETAALAKELDVPSSSIRTMVGRDERFVRLKEGKIGLVLQGAKA